LNKDRQSDKGKETNLFEIPLSVKSTTKAGFFDSFVLLEALSDAQGPFGVQDTAQVLGEDIA
jgi:hypothetical protein